jgi:hypothetical protein
MHRLQRKLRVIAKLHFRGTTKDACAFAKIPSGRLRAWRRIPQERYVQLHVKSKGPRNIASEESDFVLFVENVLSKELKAAHAANLRFYQDEELNVTIELS